MEIPDKAAQMSQRPLKRMPLIFKIPIIAIPLLSLLWTLPSSRFALLTAAGRTYQCSFWRDGNPASFVKDLYAAQAAIGASAQRLQSDGNYSLWRTRDGDFWIPERNASVLAFNLAEQEQYIYGRGAVGVRSGDIVLDGGANVGVFTRKALNAGARTVVAIEPAPENVESLRRNFAQEIVSGRVVIQPVGLWNEPAELPLRVDADSSARDSFTLSFGPEKGTVMVPLRTIDSIVETLAITSVDFIKLDIEGAEKNAIAGAGQTMARFHPRLAIAMEHLEDDPIAIPAAINSMGLGYVTTCGPCVFSHYFAVRPDTLFFTPRSN